MYRYVGLLAALALLVLAAAASAGAQPQDVAGSPSDGIVVVGGERAVSSGVFDTLQESTPGDVVRVAGSDRFATAAAVTEMFYEPGVPVVFVATGADFPDGLVAGPVAAKSGGSVLLVERDSVPEATRRQLQWLRPQRVVALGGEAAISSQVLGELEHITGVAVERLWGPTRFSTAAVLSRAHYAPAVPLVYIATGWNFPDALSAVPAAALNGAPILLTDPFLLPQATREELARLLPGGIVLVGGHHAVSAQVEEALADYTGGAVERIGGAGREETAARMSEHAFPTGADRVFIATGHNFPDALAIGPVSGGTATSSLSQPGIASEGGARPPGPILLARQNTLPAATIAELVRLGQVSPAVTAHDQHVETDFETRVDVRLQAAGEGGPPFLFTVTSPPQHGGLSGVAPDLTYTPDTGFHGVDSFQFVASNGVTTSAPASVTITVHPPGTPFADDQSITTPFGTPVAITLSGSSPGGLPLTYTVAETPLNGILTGTGPHVTYTPDPGFHGIDAFTFTVSDGISTSMPGTVTVTVSPRPRVQPPRPTAHDQTVLATKDTPIVITLGADNPRGGPLTYDYSQPANGTVTGAGPDVTYTPDPGFEGADTFDFHVNDGFTDSNTATVTVTVQPQSPVAHDLSPSTDQDTPVVITLDADNFSANPLTYHYTQPDNGTVTGAGPDVTYTPDPGFHGTDTFDFHVNDGINDSNTATVTLTVDPAPPTAADVSAQTQFETPSMITLDGTSPSGGSLTYHYAQPADGTVTEAGPDVTYTPDPGFHGTDTFTYHVNDGFNDSNTATVTITIRFTAEDYTFDAVGNTLLEVGAVASGDPAVRVAASLLDDAESGFTVTAVDLTGATGAVAWQPDGTFIYSPAAAFTGDDVFIYTISDGATTGSGTVTVSVSDMVWYVDNQASGDGRSWSPFASLTAAAAASGTGDAIFVYEGAGAYTSGITLQQDQQLLGEEAGLTLGGHDLVDTGARPSIAPTSGDAIALAAGTHVQGLNITGGAGRGLLATGLSGTVTVEDMAVTGVTGDAVHVSSGSVALSADVAVTNASGQAVTVSGLSGGSVILSGPVTDTGQGISLTTNGGSTIAFSGVLDISTNGSPAFSATGGGTVTASAAGSTLAATDESALTVEATTIGGAGLTFASISASNAQHGIQLSGTGSGPLTVTGDGSTNRNGAGGAISDMSSHGVTLSNTGPVTLRNVDVEGNDGVGIRGEGVTGLTIIAANIRDNTDDAANPATRNNVWLRSVTGTVRLEDSLVRGAVHNQVDVENTSGTMTIDVLRTELRDNDINSGLQVEAVGTSNVTLTVAGSTFADHHATGVHAFARNTATLTVSIDDNTFTGNNVAVNLAAQHTATLSSSVTDNTTSGHPSHSINVTVHEDAVHNTTVSGNTIDGTATVASVGIRLVIENDATMRALVTGNTVTGQTTGNGVRALAREDAGQLHLVLRDNHVVTTSTSPAYSLEILHQSYMCAAITGNTGSSSHPSRDLLVDLFDADASADIEGLAVGSATQAQLEAHLADANTPLRVGTLVADPSNVAGVPLDTCERPPE